MAPAALLHATTVPRGAVSPQSLLASGRTQVYLRVGSSSTQAGRTYYPIGSIHLSASAAHSPRGSAQVELSFQTSALVLLGEILGAAADSRPISTVSLAFRTPGAGGQSDTDLVDTFATAAVTSLSEQLSETPAGSVSLLLPASSSVTSTPATLQQAGPFAAVAEAPTAKASVTLGTTAGGAPAYAVTAVSLSQAASGAPINLSFASAALPLLDGIFHSEGTAGIPVLTLSVQAGAGGGLLWHTFSRLSVSSFAENLSGSVSGTAAFVIPVR